MKRLTSILITICVTSVLTFAAKNGASPILLNEIEIDPPSTTSEACQYTELKGAPGAMIPPNTYFLSINSDSGNFGFANQAVNIGGQSFGSNGTITLFNTNAGPCPNRTYGTGTTFFTYTNPLRVGTGSETYLVVQATGSLANGQDLDSDDDGAFNAALGITVLDGFALLVNPEEEFVYGASAGVINISNNTTVDQPDAVTRFPGNTVPFLIGSFYFGELAGSPDETTSYAAPMSPNFPMGGVLTPGDGPGPLVPGSARADFDGDGKTDLSVFRPSEGNWYLLRSQAGFGAITWGTAGDTLVPGDYDDDNKADTAVFRNGAWYILQSSNMAFTAINWGLPTDVPVPGDYDDDGKTDAAVFRPSDNIWYINGSAGAQQFIPWGQAGDVPVAGDFDGDGASDQTVFRAGTWLTRRSTDGMLVGTNWGLTTDVLVPADYDGDSKDDLAVFRPSDGTWYVLRSSNGSMVFTPWGTNGDIPVPGDYDGDGFDDLAVFRAGTWFVNGSTSGFVATNWGLASDQTVPSEYLP